MIHSVESIVQVVAGECGVTPAQVISDHQNRGTLPARRVAAYLALRFSGRSVTVIGRALRRDRSMVKPYARWVVDAMDRDPPLRDLVNRLERRLAAAVSPCQRPQNAEMMRRIDRLRTMIG